VFKKYLDDYYKSKIGVKEICEEVGVATSTFNRYLKREGLTTRQNHLKNIDTGIEGLSKVLKDRYSSMVNRCNGKTTDYYGHYNGKEYIPVYEWIEFCDEQKDKLIEMWNAYIGHEKSSKYAISIDRFDNGKGYTRDNMQFVTHGFNSWKRTISPIKVTYNDETNYFMAKEEASHFYGVRRQAIGEIVNKTKYHLEGYKAIEVSFKEVLDARNTPALEDYYEMLLNDESKQWDTRKRWENNNRC
jgi:predicted DNA-binding protein YlxM (UPF0122 family)